MKHKTPRSEDSLNGRKISDILKTLPENFTKERTSIANLKEALSTRAYGVLLLVLALPNLIPIPAPGLSLILGAPLFLVTFQLMLGLKNPWFPSFISRRYIKTAQLKKVCNRIIPYMQKLEIIIEPRLIYLTTNTANRLIAIICLVLSLMIMMPIPFGNALPALAICLFAIGILQRDGYFIIAGLIITLLSATLIWAFLTGLVASVFSLFGL
jgi:hypothetical protein